jgi:D-alanine-D-alanine ligase-like ATP-grasp enzyme
LWLDNLTDAIAFHVITPSFPFYTWLTNADAALLGFTGRALALIGIPLGLVSFSSDTEKALSDRSRLLWEEARRRGIDMELVQVFGRPTDIFRIRRKAITSYFRSLPLPAPVHALRMDDKVLFKKKMQENGLPVPESRSVSRFSQVLDALHRWGIVCIKPRTGSNGRHTYPFVRTEAEARTAFAHVRAISPFASVEEHLEGNLCRATCVDGMLLGFLESSHPSLTGDGISTVSELITALNEKREAGTEEIMLDASIRGYIRRRGYELDSVVPQGTSFQITYRGGRSAASTNREYGRNIHPSFIEPIERAAALTELPVVGFDLIIPNPVEPADSQRWGFIEANSLPWIDLHANPYYGEPKDLSAAVWDMWEARFAK